MLFKPKYMLQNMASLASEPRASRVSGPLGSLSSRLAGWLFGPASEPTLSLAQLASLKSLARLGSSWPAREALRAGSALCQPWLFHLENHHILFDMHLPLPILSWPMAWRPLETSYGDGA